ncbi:hypothetical protein Tco_0604689 [Tanacetum coccineum]
MIHGRVMASKPKIMQDVIEFATELIDKKISTLTECQAENETPKNSQNQQQPNKRQNTGRAYTSGHREKKYYGRSNPLCSKCNYHHDGPCAPKCHECNRVGHLACDWHYKRDCPERKNQNHENQIRGTGARGVVHALRGGEPNQEPNNIEDEIEA